MQVAKAVGDDVQVEMGIDAVGQDSGRVYHGAPSVGAPLAAGHQHGARLATVDAAGDYAVLAGDIELRYEIG